MDTIKFRSFMELCDSSLDFLKDKQYTNSLKFKPITEQDDLVYLSKIDFLKGIVKDKNIIHVGCIDHNIETIKIKIKKNKWLHKHLVESAKHVLGVDIKEEEILYIKKEFHYDAQALDITTPNQLINTKSYDFLLLPDVIEHIGNPVEFLTNIRTSHKKNIDKIVITVPNAFYKKNFIFAKKNFEEINSDHRFWFTPYTICKILTDSGFKIQNLFMYNKASSIKNSNLKKKLYRISFLRNYIFRDSIFTRLGIIVIAKF